MNKYNIRAIRTELDQYVRNHSWKNFRTKFQSLKDNPALAQAIVEHRPQHKKSTRSLLHVLCRHVRGHPPVPFDVLEAVIETSPHLLSSAGGQTPLSIALDRQAAPCIVECLLIHDETKQSLYIRNSKGDTPILQAIRHELSSEVTRLLIKHDITKRSLLIESKKRCRVPLFYVAHQELSFLGEMNGEYDELSVDLQYMLLHTYEAVEIKRGRSRPASCNLPEKTEDYRRDADSGDEWDTEEPSLKADHALLLKTTLACAHLMNIGDTTKLLAFLLPRIDDSCLQGADDADGNAILHHICRAQESAAFLQSNLTLNSNEYEGARVSLLEYLVKRNPQALLMENFQCQLPLHLAIQTNKNWEFLQKLCEASPRSLQQGRRLPLHLAILHCPNPFSIEVMELWKLFPEALEIIDDSTRLFAFQLAALCNRPCHDFKSETIPPVTNTRNKHKAPKDNAPREASQNNALDQISAVFFFLRASPHVLNQFL